MARRGTKTAVKRAAESPLSKADFEAAMGNVFRRFSEIDQRFDKVDQRFVEERTWIEKRFSQTDKNIVYEIKRQTLLLEQIERQNRGAGEQVKSETESRHKELQGLREEVLPRLEVVELVVKDLSEADRKLEKRVEALETASRR